MATLVVTQTELKERISAAVNWPPAASWVSEQTARANNAIRSAQRRFHAEHAWSFLRPRLTISLSVPYATGTIEVVDGVVTLTDGTWPTWAASGNLIVSGKRYAVSSRDSGTQLTLIDTTIDYDAETTFSLRQCRVTMDADFNGLDGPLTLENDNYQRPVEFTSEETIRKKYQQDTSITGGPRLFALYPKTFAPATGTQWVFETFPEADADYRYTGRKNIVPDDILTNASYVFPGGAIHGETFISCVLAECEKQFSDETSDRWEMEYQRLLARSIQHDKDIASPEYLGRLNDPSTRQPYRSPYRIGELVYVGHEE